MSAQITWLIQYMQCRPQVDGYDNVVIDVGWCCSGQQSNGDSAVSQSISNVCSLPTPEGTFTPYDQLTQEQVLGWIWANGIDKDATEAVVAQQIEQQINPPVVTPPLPWSAA